MAKKSKSRLLGKRLVMGAALGTVPLVGGFADPATGDQPTSQAATTDFGEQALYNSVRSSRDPRLATRFLLAYPNSALVPHILISLPPDELARLPKTAIRDLSPDVLDSVPPHILSQLGIAPERAWVARSTKGVSDGYGGGAEERDITPTIIPAAAPLAQPNTLRIIQQIDDSSERCSGIPASYRVDCLRNEYAALADNLPKTGEYSDVQKTIARAARDLNRLVRANRDTTKPRAVIRAPNAGQSRPARSGSFRAVQESTVAQTNAAARSIIDEATTRLLRSAGSSDKRKGHFQDVARALDSSKVILRS